MCVPYSKMAFLNIWLRVAQRVKILNLESFQLQLSIRQGLGDIRVTNRNKVILIKRLFTSSIWTKATLFNCHDWVHGCSDQWITLQILREFSMLGPLNAWCNFTFGTQKPLWNSARRMKNYLDTLGNVSKNICCRS